MVKGSTVMIGGVTFTCGLLLGLMLSLPGAHSPSTTLRDKRSSSPVGQFVASASQGHIGHHRSLLTSTAVVEDEENDKNTSHSKSDKLLNTFAPISKVGLLRTISGIQPPLAKPSSSLNTLDNEKSGGKTWSEITREMDTKPVYGEGEHRQVGRGSGGKQEKARRNSAPNNSTNPRANTTNEIATPPRPRNNTNNTREEEIDVKRAITTKAAEFNGLSGGGAGVVVVENGIYWSSDVEAKIVPLGFTPDDVAKWRRKVDTGKVVRITEGCGRMQNRQITFADGSIACARYRLNTDQMQGEIYSYYLAQVIGISNVPPTLLELADTRKDKWSGVDDDVVSAQWHPAKVLALTPWIDNLESVYIPDSLRSKEQKHLHPDDPHFAAMAPKQLAEIVQWSDLIVFDYLTANLDRVVNNMFNLQWNAGMMDSPTHNLEKKSGSGSLVFLDNESGLFHSYRLLGRYSNYHDELLQSLCVFRKKTAAMIARLHKSRDVGTLIQTTFEQNEPLARYLPRMPSKNIEILQSRIDAVYNQITHCQEKFSSRQR